MHMTLQLNYFIVAVRIDPLFGIFSGRRQQGIDLAWRTDSLASR